MSARSTTSTPVVRRVGFDWTAVDVRAWHGPHPEFAAGANAISLLMPYAEPFVIRAVLESADDSPDGPSPDVVAWARQEGAHHAAHRRFNEVLTSTSRTARLLDRVGRRIFAVLGRRSPAFALAFAAAFELIAFASARWAEAGLRRYFSGADEVAATLFLWHLAEEVEHKGIVHRVCAGNADARRRYPVALVAAFVALIGFTVVGGLALFVSSRHVWHPMRWFRLVTWGVSLAFVLLPVLAMSLSSSFDPEQLVDPPWMAAWLREYDPATRTMPVWTAAGTAAHVDSMPRAA